MKCLAPEGSLTNQVQGTHYLMNVRCSYRLDAYKNRVPRTMIDAYVSESHLDNKH